MRGWQLVLVTLGLLGGSRAHCDCQDDEHGSFSLEFSQEFSLSGDFPGCPFVIHHHDHSDDHYHHHDDGPDLFSSGFEDHGSFHEEISAELEVEIDDHGDHNHDHDYDHHDHDHSHEHHSHEHHSHEHHDHGHDYDYDVDYSDVVLYYRK